MKRPKRSAPGTGITGAPKLRVAQDYAACQHSATIIQRGPAGHPHYAARRCADCGAFLDWVENPRNTERRRLYSFTLAKLGMCPGLSPWERHFVHDVSQNRKWSSKQSAIIERLASQYLGNKAP